MDIENEIAELGNALHFLRAYESEGVLNFEEIIEDRDFGTFDSLNTLYKTAKEIVDKMTQKRQEM